MATAARTESSITKKGDVWADSEIDELDKKKGEEVLWVGRRGGAYRLVIQKDWSEKGKADNGRRLWEGDLLDEAKPRAGGRLWLPKDGGGEV